MLTVSALMSRADLGLRLLAGERGGSEPITWAHTCDLPDPWNWVEAGQAILTNGIALPTDAGGQVRVAEQLAHRGVSALGIAVDTGAPALTSELLESCDRLGLPVFTIPFPLPFVAVARAVSHAAMVDKEEHLRTTAALYHLVSREVEPHVGPGLEPFLREVESLLGLRIALVDSRCRHPWDVRIPLPPWARSARPMSRSTHGVAAGDEPSSSAGSPSLWENREGRIIDALPIPAVPDCLALFGAADIAGAEGTRSPEHRGSERRASDMLLHATGVIGAVLSRVQSDRVQQNRREVEVVDRILEPNDALASTSGQGLRLLGYGGAVRGGVLDGDRTHVQERSVTRLQRHGVRLSSTIRGARHLLVLEDPPDDDLETILQHCVDVEVRIGLGERCDPAAVQASLHQAIWALSTTAAQGSEKDGPSVAIFSPIRDWMGFRTPFEARSYVESVLGPLLGGGGMNEDLLLTLRTYLSHARSPQRTATALLLHRQTVGQRLRRIETLLDRELSDTDALARIWLALKLLDATSVARTVAAE